MKIVKQSHKIIEQSSNLVNQIGLASRKCYKSEDKFTGDDTLFVGKTIKRGHNSCLEFAVIHLNIFCDHSNPNEVWDLLESNYIITNLVPATNTVFCTASVRGWREFIIKSGRTNLSDSILLFLSSNHQDILFEDLLTGEETSHNIIEFFDPSKFEKAAKCGSNVFMEHTHMMVEFVTNRAVTHEIVRHRPDSYLQESQRYCRYGTDVTFIEPTAFDFSAEDYELWAAGCRDSETHYLELLKNNTPQASRTVLANSCKTEIIVYTSLVQWLHIFAMRCSPAAEPSMQTLMYPLLGEVKEMFPGHFDQLKRSVG